MNEKKKRNCNFISNEIFFLKTNSLFMEWFLWLLSRYLRGEVGYIKILCILGKGFL